ncbi:MAG: hypothetical protein PVSMB6_05110 [Steroidobacteraceae bacterium]
MCLWLGVASPAFAQEQQPGAGGVGRWFDPASAPFIPVPEIDLDPNSGTTLGVIPTWLLTDDSGAIRRIYAPDIIHNPYFGYGARARVFDFPSFDTEWSVVGGAKERVESEFDAQYEAGRERNGWFSYRLRSVYDRSGTPRFYGVGNRSRVYDVSVYTPQQKSLSAQFGWNITHRWQLAYYLMPREVTITAGSLAGIPSTAHRYPGLLGLGTTREVLSRGLITYDTRDDPTIPTRGAALVLYGGVASRRGLMNDSLFSEAGADVRIFWSPAAQLTWAFHSALRYLPHARRAPFWALSSLGGDECIIGGDQPLRGYGLGRFYDRDSFSTNLEMRRQIADFDAVSTHIALQLTPFMDLGSVFPRVADSPFARLHKVLGIGLRALARPFVVGYLDVGRGSEGVVAFSGINYPF